MFTKYINVNYLVFWYLQTTQSVNQENYLKIAKLFIFIESYKHLNVQIDEILHDLSDGLVASLLDVLCEFYSIVDISSYQPITSLRRSSIYSQHSTLTASKFYSWDYVLLRDIKNIGSSLSNAVNNGIFGS